MVCQNGGFGQGVEAGRFGENATERRMAGCRNILRAAELKTAGGIGGSKPDGWPEARSASGNTFAMPLQRGPESSCCTREEQSSAKIETSITLLSTVETIDYHLCSSPSKFPLRATLKEKEIEGESMSSNGWLATLKHLCSAAISTHPRPLAVIYSLPGSLQQPLHRDS